MIIVFTIDMRSLNRYLCSIIDENYAAVYFQALTSQLNRLGRNVDAILARDLPSQLSKQEGKTLSYMCFLLLLFFAFQHSSPLFDPNVNFN